MKVTLVMVSSVNGKITKGDDPHIYSWTSQEDKDFFFSLLRKFPLLVMGSKTYEASRKTIQLNHEQLRIVLTSTPEKYEEEAVSGQLEFSDRSPRVLIEDLAKEGYEEMLLVGGGGTNERFFAAGLVNEMYVTIEPKLFGHGKHLVAEGDYTSELQLIDYKVLNKKGTLLLHYQVVAS